jgi:putative ABC transport system permease protein
LQIFSVNLRRRELGLRIALGAAPGALARLVLGESLRLGLLGASLGTAAAPAVTRFLSSLLFGVGTLDLWTMLLVPTGLVGVVLLAGWIPTRRALRTDPGESLRSL